VGTCRLARLDVGVEGDGGRGLDSGCPLRWDHKEGLFWGVVALGVMGDGEQVGKAKGLHWGGTQIWIIRKDLSLTMI